jgi:hypothetical protein
MPLHGTLSLCIHLILKRIQMASMLLQYCMAIKGLVLYVHTESAYVSYFCVYTSGHIYLPCGCIPGGTPKGTRIIASLSPGRLASDVGGGTPTGGAVWGSPVLGLS